MSTEVKTYSIIVYGGPSGYSNNRAQIQLQSNGDVLGWVRFHDPGMAFPEDGQVEDKIHMHLPTSMFQSVLDILRNEKQVTFTFRAGSGFLDTGSGTVGGGDIK